MQPYQCQHGADGEVHRAEVVLYAAVSGLAHHAHTAHAEWVAFRRSDLRDDLPETRLRAQGHCEAFTLLAARRHLLLDGANGALLHTKAELYAGRCVPESAAETNAAEFALLQAGWPNGALHHTEAIVYAGLFAAQGADALGGQGALRAAQLSERLHHLQSQLYAQLQYRTHCPNAANEHAALHGQRCRRRKHCLQAKL